MLHFRVISDKEEPRNEKFKMRVYICNKELSYMFI